VTAICSFSAIVNGEIPSALQRAWNSRPEKAHRMLEYKLHLSQAKKVVYRRNHSAPRAQAQRTQCLACAFDHRQPRGWYVCQALVRYAITVNSCCLIEDVKYSELRGRENDASA